MSRIFRHGDTYAIVKCARSLGYICIGGIEKHITRRRNIDSTLKCQDVLKKLPAEFDTVRYDYIGERFEWYQGRYEGNRQYVSNCKSFKDLIKYYTEPVFFRWIGKHEYLYFTGKEIIQNEWFPWSKLLLLNREFKDAKSLFDEWTIVKPVDTIS